jgi:hypothetical protein
MREGSRNQNPYFPMLPGIQSFKNLMPRLEHCRFAWKGNHKTPYHFFLLLRILFAAAIIRKPNYGILSFGIGWR